MNKSLSADHLVGEFENYMKGVARLSDRTIKAYKYDLGFFVNFLEENDIERADKVKSEDIEAYLASIPQSKTGSTANYNRKLSSLRSFYSFLEKRGLQNNPIDDFKPIKKHKREISYLTSSEMEELIYTIKNHATPYYKKRDLAIVTLFLNVGIRVNELAGLKFEDIELRKDEHSYIRVFRKGGSEDYLPISDKTAERIKNYIDTKDNYERSDSIFLSRKGSALKPNSIYHLVKKYLLKADIRKKKMGPHMLRHSVAVSLLKNNINLKTIQKILGHKSLDTTALYTHVEQSDVEKAVDSISI